MPFTGESAFAIAAIALIYLFSFFIRGAVGFGSAMPAVLLTSWILPPHHAVILALTSGVAGQLQLIRQGLRNADWPIVLSVAPFMIMGITGGVLAFTVVEAPWLIILLGIVVIALLLASRGSAADKLTHLIGLHRQSSARGMGALSGFIGSVVGAGGMYMLVVYLRHSCRTPEKVRGTNIIVNAIYLLWRLAVTFAAGLITMQSIAETLILLPIIFSGIWLGTLWHSFLDPERFGRFLEIVLLVAAVGLVAKGGALLVHEG